MRAGKHSYPTMKRPQSAPAGLLQRRLQTAQAAWARKDFQSAIEILESANRLAPATPGILIELGRANGLRYNYEAAERWFEKTLAFAPRKTEMLTTIAEHCYYFRNPALAERYLRRALEQPDAPAQACVKLAELYERLRRLPEAEHLVERALKLAPADPAALLVRARLERLAGRLETAETELRTFITQPIRDHWIHAQAWYELATILDRQEKYDEAVKAFVEAKALLRPHAANYLAHLNLYFARLKLAESNFNAAKLRDWAGQGSALNPPRRLALLCGHARSGTTLLEQVLDAHPDIVSAEETSVFSDDALTPLGRNISPDPDLWPVLEAATLPDLQAARTSYFRHMELALGKPIAGRLLIDKNPILTPVIPGFVRLLPETKFMVALRDPRDVALSCFMQPHVINPSTAAFLNLESTADYYVAIMSQWRSLAPLMPVPYLEVRYEDMVADLESVARKTLDFLGVPWDERVLGFYEHAQKKRVLSPTYADVTQPVYQRARGRWRHYQKYLEPHLAKLEPLAKAFGYE